MQLLVIEMPLFYPAYKSDSLGYSDDAAKENLRKELTEISRGYCMYCYSRIVVDNKHYGHLEHAIEKNNSAILVDCVPNIAISCVKCNDSFKKIGEKKRKLAKEVIARFEDICNCENEKPSCNCKGCAALVDLRDKYILQDQAQIILQPLGVVSKYSKEQLMIQYDVLKSEFQPATYYHKYDKRDINFIAEHIRRFRLNDINYKTRSVRNFAKNVVDTNGVIGQMEQPNMVAELFADMLREKDKQERIKICEAICKASSLSLA